MELPGSTGRRLDTSVVIPCYNVRDFLDEALTSIARQTLPVREIVLVDDGSTPPLARPDPWDGPPLVMVRTPNRGLAAARNTGIQHCSGDLIAFLDADDMWSPDKVEKQTAAIENNPRVVASYTQCRGGKGFFPFGPYPPADVSDDEFMLVMWYNLFFPPSCVVVRRDALNTVGPFVEDLGNGEDIELWMRLLTVGSFAQIPEPLCHYRLHEQQFTKDISRKMFGSKRAREVMIGRHADRLVAAGLDRRHLWDSYRNDILLVYFRRDFRSARKLLWDYWRDHPSDLSMLKYAVLSLLPPGMIGAMADTERLPATGAQDAADAGAWNQAVSRIRHVLGRSSF